HGRGVRPREPEPAQLATAGEAYTSRMAPPKLDLDKLTRDEKLELIEMLELSLETDAEAPIPDWHMEILNQRLDEMDREGAPTGLSWEEVRKEIESRLK
ncbi:MAG TPA: addiction module protein, partial [Candidatus Polarisedimenticolia bacterium]|nr:addiction module protein [Candidatus Polarisedimenticolia bacterium]